MQQRTLNHLTRLIESLGFETTKTFAYANYGKVNIHKVDEVCPIGSVSFDFQSGTMKFSITINGENLSVDQIVEFVDSNDYAITGML